MWLLYHAGTMKKTALIIAVIVALAAAAVAGALWMSDRKMSRGSACKVVPVPYAPQTAGPQARKYLFESRGCGECHGMDGAGKVVIDDPNGMHVRSPDITPAKTGKVAAIPRRMGACHPAWRGSGGRALLIMPSEDYNRMNDADFAALVAYIRTLPAGRALPRRCAFRHRAVLYGAGVVKDRREDRPPAATLHAVAVGATKEHGAYVANMCMGCHGETFWGARSRGAARLAPCLQPHPGGKRHGPIRHGRALHRDDAHRQAARRSAVSKVMPFETLGKHQRHGPQGRARVPEDPAGAQDGDR
jgi:cytochrome c553